MKSISLLGVFLGLTVLAGAAVANDQIFADAPQAMPAIKDVSLETLADSPTMQKHTSEVLAAAGAKTDKMQADGVITAEENAQIKGWFKALPFQRILDVRVSFLSGIPDMFGVCLQADPNQYLSIDACAGTIVLISAISVHVSSRFLHYVNINAKTNQDGSVSYSGNEFGFGPSVGYRREALFGFDTAGTAQGIDGLLSLEYVHWISRYFGLGLQLDGGVTYNFDIQGSGVRQILPNAKLSIGLSF